MTLLFTPILVRIASTTYSSASSPSSSPSFLAALLINTSSDAWIYTWCRHDSQSTQPKGGRLLHRSKDFHLILN
ncbi:hypothetical protein L6452_16869 [Arctium lappa]|uniref:Uncharacterized protein n=1 Tax=Arctium lappa TaxID=4217 RepID=A0ACB9C1Q0_ARCLA|nr:hypothetical protein L6452_16869 [Arctium lappa]